jgi:hypothetical protein
MKKTPAVSIAIAAAFQSAMLLAQEPGGMQGMNRQKHHELMPIHAKVINAESTG